MEKYVIEWYENTACAERRPETVEDVESDYKVYTYFFESDLEALDEACYISHLLYEDEDDHLESVEQGINMLDNSDWGDGAPFVIKIYTDDKVLYDTGMTKDSMIMDLNDDYDEWYDDDFYDDEEDED